MAKFILSTFLVLASSLVQAESLPSHVELCALEQDENSAVYSVTKIFDIKDDDTISKANFELVRRYFYSSEGKNYSFAQIKRMFSEGGEEQYNDLYIFKYVFKKSRHVYIEVRTYPGDNAVGVVFDAKTKEIVATNGDGSYEISIAEEDTLPCYDYNEGK